MQFVLGTFTILMCRQSPVSISIKPTPQLRQLTLLKYRRVFIQRRKDPLQTEYEKRVSHRPPSVPP